MKTFQVIFIAIVLVTFCCNKSYAQNAATTTPIAYHNVISSDIDNFWEAFYLIQAAPNQQKRIDLFQEMVIDRGSRGLKLIMQARDYRADEYVAAIVNYPKFWESIKENMYQAKTIGPQLVDGIDRLRKVYPDLKPANIYFTVGVFRTGGTILDGQVLIGTETALAGPTACTEEFPDNAQFNNLKKLWSAQEHGHEHVCLTNVHEYIHTQQNSIVNSNLLFKCVNEGVAEFISCHIMETNSNAEAIAYGFKNDERIKAAFVKDMFQKDTKYWLWSSQENEFGVRDLGYYVGYAIAKRYYENAEDKMAAIKTMIELDFSDNASVEAYIESTGYFNESLSQLKEKHQQKYIGDIIKEKLEQSSIKKAINYYKKLWKKQPKEIIFNADELNNLGYAYLGAKKMAEAIALFKLNVVSYPKHWNVYDSLGEAYWVMGDTTNSVINYRKSLELNPSNQYGIAALKAMGHDWVTE